MTWLNGVAPMTLRYGRMASARFWAALAMLSLLAVASMPRFSNAQMRPAPPRKLVQVKGDVWRAGNGNWWSFIYVTPDGIVLVDPINTDFATWLKGELARQFPNKPVRYIIMSHSHPDHSAGGGVFADSHPLIVAQERVLNNMDGRWPHMPGDMQDRNNNGTLEAEEIIIPTLEHPGICGGGPGFFENFDKAHTGHVTAEQWWAELNMTRPDIVYSERMTIMLGGRKIELMFPGLNHADVTRICATPSPKAWRKARVSLS